MGCMKCGNKTESSRVFCNECLAKMESNPVKPGTVVVLPNRPVAAATKKKPLVRRYLWDAEDKIDTLHTKMRWLTFALVIAILGFLVSLTVVAFLLYRHGYLERIARLFFH